jgi:hypothetical protein
VEASTLFIFLGWSLISVASDHTIHVSGFGGMDAGVWELDSMAQIDVAFGHG